MHRPHGCDESVGSPWQLDPRGVDVAALLVQSDQVGVEREQVAVPVLVRMSASLDKNEQV